MSTRAGQVQLLVRFLVGYVLFVIGGSATFEPQGPPQPYGLPLFLAGVAILLHLSVDLLVYFGWNRMKGRKDGKPRPRAKSYYESLRFIVNALLVTSGVVMGLLGSDSSPKALALVFLGLSVLFGLFNLSILIGALAEEFTVIEDTATHTVFEDTTTQKMHSYITLSPIHESFIVVLLNFQFMAFLIGLTIVGFR